MENELINKVIDKPLFTPHYLNIEYVFSEINEWVSVALSYILDPETWNLIGLISGILSVFCIGIITYTLVRAKELRQDEKERINKAIADSLFKKKQKERSVDPRWHYVLNLVESLNPSDWRVAVIEADSMLEEFLRDKNLTGETLNDLLKDAQGSGYQYVEDAWKAHVIRNQIAHEGSDFAFNQNEARRAIKMYENFFEELGVI
jgi:hypothetical protein